MRFVSYFLLLILAVTSSTFSQESDDTTVVLKKANELLYSDPAQALRIGEHLKHSATSAEEILQTNLLLAKGNQLVGNYTQSLVAIRAALQIIKENNSTATAFETYLLAAEIYSNLNLYEIANKFLSEAKKLTSGNLILEKKLVAYELFVKEPKINTAAKTRFVSSIAGQNEMDYAFITKGTPSLLTALDFVSILDKNQSALYFKKSLESMRNKSNGAYWEMIVLFHYGTFLFHQNDFVGAEKLLNESLEKSESIGNPYFQYQIYNSLSKYYLTIGNQSKFQVYKTKATEAENLHDSRKLTATNFAFECLQKEAETACKIEKERHYQSTLVLLLVGLFLLLSWFLLRVYYNSRSKHLLDIISYLKLIHQPASQPFPSQKIASKNLSIPKETEDLLLAKLEKFEGSKRYLNKDISLAQIASLFETNTKYLSEVINKHKGKNINLYINELRIKYIVEKLKTDSRYLNYKVSYLAEECGFSSHSIFSSVFKNITGLTPNTFIQFLHKDQNEINKTLNA